MGFWNKWPYTTLQNLNLDWILTEIKKLREEGLTLVDIRRDLDAVVEQDNTNAENIRLLQGSDAQTAKNADALGGKPPEAYASVNLLDNSDWRITDNIINQRAITSGTDVNTWAYFFDRWKNRDVAMTVIFSATGGVTLTGSGSVYQIVPRPYISTSYTCAALFSDGELLVASGSDHEYEASQHIIAAYAGTAGRSITLVRDSSTNLEVYLRPNGKTVMWIALYEGIYTAETLSLYVPKSYGVELIECQRYFHIYATSEARPANGLDCSPPMRLEGVSKGTIEKDGRTYFYNSAEL